MHMVDAFGAGADPVARLLVWAVRWSVDAPSAGPPPVDDLAPDVWSRALSTSVGHGVLPLLRRGLDGVEGVPEAVRSDLERGAQANERRALQLTGELLRIVRRLGEADIAAVPWKGPTLGQQAYGSPSMRMYFDLDVLVRKADLVRAAGVLQADGLEPDKPMTERQQRNYVDHQGELELVRRDDGLWVELHWAVVPTYYAPPWVAEDPWRRLVRVRLGREMVAALAPEDDLEALCVHGSKHRWERLLWIADIGMLAKAKPDLDWEMLLERARQKGTLRMVRLGLLLAASVTHAPIPAHVLHAARGDRAATTLQANVHRALFQPVDSSLEGFLFHARMRERGRDRARYVFGSLYTPSGADWEGIDLPAGLFPLYRALRPLRLGVKFGRAITGSAVVWARR